MKKREDFFDRYLDKIYDAVEMLHKQGYGPAECRYAEVVATILLFICDSLRAISFLLFALSGFLAGALASFVLKALLQL